ncbi:hypothetical protein [Candidatus Paracaedibacter symbiosus]|uniref:hypothetical protein n=1 Tax=Candidatus Paracaedibacter symbiosus TaxID=244582 RepID=UPI000509D6BF|nr:hypothetical protein [Candidatus Paracaedibacter symbiosus]
MYKPLFLAACLITGALATEEERALYSVHNSTGTPLKISEFEARVTSYSANCPFKRVIYVEAKIDASEMPVENKATKNYTFKSLKKLFSKDPSRPNETDIYFSISSHNNRYNGVLKRVPLHRQINFIKNDDAHYQAIITSLSDTQGYKAYDIELYEETFSPKEGPQYMMSITDAISSLKTLALLASKNNLEVIGVDNLDQLPQTLKEAVLD